ncbi:phosphoglycolate phosphatase [Pelagibacteraceae bacterium]|jgi:phosphoglycolate phosphatase|nr:phosphoglycolate phosphatase [Pelagibacteraceae bacterium]|tara:strand:+ start:946 stop:1614 length:669 start_codon:yes stop_codon:yes gene_type:complete
MPINNRKIMIFDLDGTLVDTAPDFRNSVNFMLNHYNEPPVTLEEIRDWVGYGGRELIKRTMIAKQIEFDDNKLDEMLAIFLSHYTENIDDDSKLYDNVKETLNFLKKENIKLSVCTNKDETLSRTLLEKLDVLHLFDYLAGAYTFENRKPHPMPLIKTLEYLDMNKNEAVMIGDSVTDLKAAQGAGIPVVLVDYGYTDNKDIYNEADLVISNFSSLKALIRS